MCNHLIVQVVHIDTQYESHLRCDICNIEDASYVVTTCERDDCLCHVVVDRDTEDLEIVEDAKESLFAGSYLQRHSHVDLVYVGAVAVEVEHNIAC